MKRLVFILIITAMLFGCAFADVSKDITIDMTKEFVPESVMNNIKEGTEISYLIDEENSKLILELTNKDKTQTIERDVKLVYPEYSIIENITLDLTKGIDIRDYITTDQNTKVDYIIDEENSSITFLLTNGIWSKAEVRNADIIVPEYAIAENIEICKLFGYRISDFVSAEDGVEIVHSLDEDNAKLIIDLSKGEWKKEIIKDVNFIEPTYPIYYKSVQSGRNGELKEDNACWLRLDSASKGVQECNRDNGDIICNITFSYDAEKEEMYTDIVTNTLTFYHEAYCSNPAAISINNWNEGGVYYCKAAFKEYHVHPMEFDNEYLRVDQDGFIFLFKLVED